MLLILRAAFFLSIRTIDTLPVTIVQPRSWNIRLAGSFRASTSPQTLASTPPPDPGSLFISTKNHNKTINNRTLMQKIFRKNAIFITMALAVCTTTTTTMTMTTTTTTTTTPFSLYSISSTNNYYEITMCTREKKRSTNNNK